MLLTRADRLPLGNEWSYEVKWDGYRCIATLSRGTTDLHSRHGTRMTEWFPSLATLAECIGRDAVLDGEVVSLDERGHPDFYALRRGVPTFVAFDVLSIEGRDVTGKPLVERRELLAELVRDCLPVVMVSRPFDDGASLLAMAEALNLEGVVAKRLASRYRSGIRTREWVKVKTTAGRAEALQRLETTWR